jgi:putative transposase
MTRWPHSPSHTVDHPGTYILTASTYHKALLFSGEQRLDLLHDILLQELEKAGWQLQAWAVFANHYHFVGLSPESGLGLKQLTRAIHGRSAIELNKLDGTPGRMVWYRAWDTRLSYERSYLTRLAYVHNNPVRHGLVQDAQEYPWCSARWFADRADRPFYKSVMSFKTDGVNVYDDF